MEVFFGLIDETDKSDDRLRVIRDLIRKDRETHPDLKVQHIALGPEADTFSKSKNFQRRLGILDEGEEVHIEKVPQFLDYYSKIKSKKSKRFPSAENSNPSKILEKLKNEKFVNKYLGREFWTVFRFVTSSGGAFYGFYHIQGLSVLHAAGIAMWGGIASAAMTYKSERFGEFLTNGKWSHWLIESDHNIAKSFRKAYGINSLSLKDSLVRNQEYFRQNFPTIYEGNKDLFYKESLRKAKDEVTIEKKKNDKKRTQSILARLKHAEEYAKWYITELVFTGMFLKLPQIVGGVTAFNGALPLTADIFWGSFIGTIAQGPGDIAIQVRKYQEVEELKDKIRKNLIKVENKEVLLSEIEKVLATKGEFAKYAIHDGSHYKLLSIENKARFKASVFSFFSVTGVVFELSGIPAGSYILGSLAVTGAIYLSEVKGLIRISKVKDSIKNYVEKVRTGQFTFSLQDWRTRLCSAPFLVKPKLN
jgi:hypothetical protein